MIQHKRAKIGVFGTFIPLKKRRGDTLMSPQHSILTSGMLQGMTTVVTARGKGTDHQAQEACRRTTSSNVLPGQEFWSHQGGHREELGADEQTTM